MVQCLRLCASTARGMGSIPGWGIKIPHDAKLSQKKKLVMSLPKRMCQDVCISNISNRQKLETTEVSINSRVDK